MIVASVGGAFIYLLSASIFPISALRAAAADNAS